MLRIRRAAKADVDSLVPLKASLHALHVARRPDVFKPMTPTQVAAWLRDRLADEATYAWLAEEGVELTGYLLAARRERAETSYSLARDWFEIDEVAVDVRHRRRGIAGALIECAMTHARESGLDSIELTTWAFNEPGQQAFERMGFQPMIARYALSARSLA
jgi:GNAT superfamily N-acetyltransferase